FILQAARIPEEDRTLLLAAAHVVLHGADGPLTRQLEMAPPTRKLPELLRARPRLGPVATGSERPPPEPTPEFANGFGGFSSDGKEYVIRLTAGRWTPAPWSNVMANAHFGCLVTEAGCGCTWSENSRENR